MAFIPLTDEEKRILQNGGAGETEPPEESAGGLFGGINVSSIPEVASARDRLTDLRTEAVDAEADLSPAPAADLDSLARSGGIDLSPYEDEPFRGEERLNPAAPGSGMFVELSPKEMALVDGERRFSNSTRFLAGMFRDAQSYDPETYSRNVQASLATRIPVGMMVQDPEVRDEAWRQKMTLDQLDTLERVGPKLRSWLQIPGRMAAVWDDLPALMALESLVEQETYQAETSPFVRGYRGNSALVERSQIGSKMLAGTATQKDLDRLAVLEEEMARNQVEGEGLWATLISGLGGQIAQRQEQARQALWGGSLGILAGSAATLLFPPAAIPLLGAAAFGGAAGGMAAGAAAGATKAGFELESGTAFLEFRNITDENGNRIPEGAARIAALVYGAGASLVETAQFATIARFLPQGAKLFSKQALTQLLKTPTFRDALVSGAAEYGKTLTFEALTEGVQRGMEIAVGEGLKAYGNLTGGEFDHTTIKEAIAGVADETVSAFGSFALGLLPGGFTTFALDMKAANQARRNQNFFKALGEIASESKTLKRLPEGMGEYATELTKNGPVAEIGIDAKGFSETLMQIGADPEEVAGTLGIAPEDLREAAATGGDVWLPTGVYMEKIAGTELNQALLPDLRLGEGAMTAREAKAFEEERKNRLHEDSEAARKYLEESGAETSDVDYAKSVVKTQLEGLGIKWLGKNEAESYSTLFAAYAVQAASRWNTTVKEWVDRLNLTIRDNGDGTKSMVAEPKTPAATPAQPAIDADGVSAEGGRVVPLGNLRPSETINPERLAAAKDRLEKAKRGEGPKREPLTVWDRGDGTYSIADGNHTYTALNEAGALSVPVKVEPVRNRAVTNIDTLYAEATKAEPEFNSLMGELQSQLGGELLMRPEMKTAESVNRKALNPDDYNGDYSRVVDVLGGSLIFETEEDLLRAVESLRDDNRIVRIKDRWSKPTPEGYRDYLLNVRLPGGYVGELQVHHRAIMEVKNSIGHDFYKLAGMLHDRGEEKLRDGVNDLSREFYENALATGQSAPAFLSASSLETFQDLMYHLKAVSDDMALSDALGKILNALNPLAPSSAGSHLPSGPVSKTNALSSSESTKNSNVLLTDTTSEKIIPDNSGQSNGIVSEVVTGEGTTVQTRFRVVDASELIASNTESFAVNKKYPKELQPRKRDRAAGISQVEKILSGLDPERLGESRMASDGAPIVGEDMVVESGNGRTIALKLMYKRGAATKKARSKYISWLKENAGRFGLLEADIDAVKSPVLVRVRETDVDRAQFAKEANVASVAAMSASETARADAERMSEKILGTFRPESDLLAPENRPFVREFLSKVVPPNEWGMVTTSAGTLSRQGIVRLQNALAARAYGDHQVLERMAESEDDNIKNVNKGLIQAAPVLAVMEDRIQAGLLKAEYSIAGAVSRAVNQLSILRERGETVQEFLSQVNMFEEVGISDDVKRVLSILEKHKRAPSRIASFLAGYARLVDAQGSPDQAVLFEEQPPTAMELMDAADKNTELTLYQDGAALDVEYLAAVEAGDMETAQRMVDEAAEESGLPILDDSAATAYKVRRTAPPQKSVKAYKLFKTKKNQPGQIFPLFVGATDPLPQGVWLDAEIGPEAKPSKTGKPQVKSKLGPLAFRPGWHAGDLPLATHIGVKGTDGKIFARADNEVWAEVEMAADVDYQPEADANGRTKSGAFSAALADIKHMPVDGYYRYKTNPNMTGSWIISGSMKINRILSEAEVNAILTENGAKPMPWEGGPLDLGSMGLATEAAKNVSKILDPVTYDDHGNVIPLSQRFDPDTPDIRYQMSTADTLDAEYLAAVEAGDMETAQGMVDEAAKEAGFTVQHVFHGSKRIDRLGNELKPERATSGPMPFFTDDPTIAENYSKNKADTSIEIPESYTGWFKVAVGRGKPKTIDQAWLYLSLDKRRELAAKLPHVVNTDENGEVADEFRLTDDEYGMTNKSHWDFVLREKRGNVLAAAVEIWLDSGELFDQEERFLEILRLAGLDGVVYDSPWLEQPGVLEAHLAIRTPFDTSAISDDDFAALEAASKGKRGSANVVDEWDKRRFSGREWIELLAQDRRDGTSFAWTSVPDWVSRELHRMGYDGIKDQGGKYTGEGHTVWIPFFPWQVKKADGITRDDQGNVIPLSQRFDAGVKDMRYQTAYHGSPHRFTEFSTEYIGTGERAQAFGWGLYFADKKEVAEYYRTSVTNRQPTDILIDGASITSLKEKMPSAPFPAMIRAALNGADGDIDRAKEYLRGRKEGNPNLSPNRLKQYDDAINFVESLRGHEIRIERPGPGQIYEVDIPDDNVLLDWDKPLNEQPEAIRKALKTVEGINVKSWLKGNPTGKEVYNQLVGRAQDAGLTIGKNYADDRQAASEILNGVGIKGIRYLDALSRDGSGDSRNYVIWDDKAIAIQQTYYQKSAGGRQYPTQGFINRSDRGITITLTPKANRSTFLHELGHLFLWDLESLVRAGKADSRTAGDWEVVRSWWGGHARDLAEWIVKHGTVSEDVRALFAAPDGAGIVRAALAGKEADAVLADAVRVAAEEYWARGFEQYLFEGVAPSRALRHVFDNFKRWLARVYRALKGAPDVELSDEVRAVMDRLLASDEEVDQARSLRESERLRTRLIQQGIPTVEADALREAADEAASEAKTKLLAVLLKELGAETREMARKRREAAEPGIREAMRGESAAWKTYDDLLQFADTGYNLAPDERYGEANGRLTSPEGTVPMEAAADLLGLEGVEELQALLAEEARNPFEAELNARLDAEVRDLENKASDRETMQTLAEEMLSGEARLRLLALEQAILARKIGDLQFGPESMEDQPSAWETTAQQARQMSAQVRAYREVAEQLIADKRVRDARAASRYLAAARKAGREAYELALKGRYEESLAAKDREMMSTALYQASLAARDEMEKAEKHLKKYWGGRKRLRAVIGEEHFAQVMGLTERYGFNGEDELSGDRPHLGEWVAAANAQIGADPNNQGAELPVAKWLITDDYKDRKMSWKDLTVTEFRELVEAVEAIDYFGRSRNKLLAAEREADFAKAKADLEASVTAVHGTLKETPLDPDYRGAGVIGRYLASSDRVEHILRRLDGFKDMAVAWLTFFDPVVKAERAEMKRMREAKSRLETIFSVYSSEERGEMTKKKYTLQQLDPSTGKPLVLSRENVIALLLNWGALENREEVVFGYGFDRTVWNSGKGWIHYGSDEEYWAAFRMGSAEVEKLFSQVLEEKDYEVAQAVWDLNESYWPDIAAMSKKVTGVTPKKVKHLPVTSASGVTYRGGYLTLDFRPESNWNNFVVSEKESSKALYAPQGSRAHTKSGHTEERHHGERGKRLLRLDLGVETEHLRDALHDLYFRPVIRDLNKLLADPQVQKTIIGSIGMEAFKQFQPWVNGLANAYRTPSNYGEQMMQKVMGRTSAAILGWSLSSAAKQVFGWFPAVQVLGYKRTALAAFNFWRNPFQWGEMRDFAFGKSEYLRDRVRSFDRDVKAAMEAVTASPVRGRWSAVQETFFLFAGWMDMAVSLPVWTAAWDKGMLEFNGDEAKALEYADFVVRSTQNTGAAKDLAAIQQGSPAWKSMTMFYTAFGSMFQQTREQWFRGHGVRDIPRLAAFTLTMYVLPALLEDLMSGRGPEEDEPDDILRWALNSTLQYSASQLILVRDVVNAASSGFSYRMSPMASAGTAAAKVMNDLLKSAEWALGGDEPDWEKIPGHLVEISGPAFGLPSNQIMRTMKAVGRYLDNDPDWSPWDFVITPPKKKGRR